jgi:hypothetical protein
MTMDEINEEVLAMHREQAAEGAAAEIGKSA